MRGSVVWLEALRARALTDPRFERVIEDLELARILGPHAPTNFLDALADAAYSLVATPPSPATSGTSLVVTAGEGARFPAAPFDLTIWASGAQPQWAAGGATAGNFEIVRVTAKSGDTLTITRAQYGTTARSVVVGDQVAQNLTANMLKQYQGLGFPCDGRLTLTSGTPVTTADVSGGGTLYFTPFRGNQLALYDGTNWPVVALAEISLVLAITSGKNYDVFVYNNAGTLTLELSAAWTNDTTRADALTTQDGIYVKSADHTRRYLGTIRASGTNQTSDAAGGVTTQVGGQRYVWNYYNRVKRELLVIDTTDTWSYTTNTWRQANGATGNKVEYVVGLQEDPVEAHVWGVVYLQNNISVAAKVGVGIDSTTAATGLVQGGYTTNSAGYHPISGHFYGYPGLGYHALNRLEKGADITSTFLGDNGGDGQQTGLEAAVFA